MYEETWICTVPPCRGRIHVTGNWLEENGDRYMDGAMMHEHGGHEQNFNLTAIIEARDEMEELANQDVPMTSRRGIDQVRHSLPLDVRVTGPTRNAMLKYYSRLKKMAHSDPDDKFFDVDDRDIIEIPRRFQDFCYLNEYVTWIGADRKEHTERCIGFMDQYLMHCYVGDNVELSPDGTFKVNIQYLNNFMSP
uniref:Uncharacterized protein n=1 Tax=Acrobeloides nanus TaxID=290746 RepID=A0A914C850_9BILA